jgi:hypothetical protein
VGSHRYLTAMMLRVIVFVIDIIIFVIMCSHAPGFLALNNLDAE